MIKTLNKTHFDEAIAIAKLRKRIGGLVGEIDVDVARSYICEKSEERVAFGYFENGELISWIAIKLHSNEKRGKFWIIALFFSKKVTNYFSFKQIDKFSLFRHCFEYAESLHYYTYYYSTSIRIIDVYERQWKRNNVIPLGRYEQITVDIIPPNTKPETLLYWSLMNKQLKSTSIVIMKRSLNKEFRKC